ncbi:hypothetical protein ACFU9F_01905 [Streptomyces zhihengii]|uniref:DinB/UmuC family translesion DNA polymerase n=1 Tax=Streptomyces zhihengii TaxID=1818004 RepID=UPI0036983465
MGWWRSASRSVIHGELGERMHDRRQAARALTLTVGFAGGSRVERSRRLPPGASAHTDDLRDLASTCSPPSASSAPGYAAWPCGATTSWTRPRSRSSSPSIRSARTG